MTSHEAETHALGRRVTAGYAAGSVGTGGFGVLPGLVLAYYLTDTLAVGALLAAVIVVIPKAIDVAINPVIGARSDKDAHTSAGRTRLMWIGSAAIIPLFILTFCAPTAAGPGLGALWVLVFFSLTAIAYACFQVPYVALPAYLTGDYHERTRLISVRIAVLALTILIVGAGAPAIRDAFGGGAAGYAVMAVCAALLIGGGMAASTATAGRAAQSAGEPTAHRPRDGFVALRDNHHYRTLLTVFVVQALATAVMLAGAQYLATYVLDDKSALTLVFASLVGPALIVMPLWVRLGRRWGKRRALLAASALFLIASLVLTVAIWAPGGWIFAPIALCGVAYAGLQTFPLAMLPDVIDEYSTQTGRNQGGALSGLWTAGETLGLALGPGVYLLVLAATGFRSSTADQTVTQSDTAVAGITAGFALVPAVLIAISIAVLSRYERSTRR
ncbi:MAG: MFS transporter [Gordonia sp. (in: high G+C Gram-positive bacteria)]|uniref:MFS transporter n=1 Tax=Gordonia sp. (in: high G+C Gram-positive bacteria) TaxID=84139 RepID=UPI0039E59442